MIAASSRTSRNAWLLPTLMSALVFSSIVRADDIAGISGLWATDARNCDKIFSKTATWVLVFKKLGSVRERVHH